MKFLVTGCSSYIARYVIEKLLTDGEQIIGISRTVPSITHHNFQWLKHDLSKGPCKINSPAIDIIIHFAAQSLLNKTAVEYLNSNILLSRNVCEMALELQPDVLVYTSSMKIYGEIREKEATEDTDMINPDLYGITKYYGEKLLQETVPTVSLRLPGVVGVGSHGWIDGVYKKLKINESLKLFNSHYNHVVHVYDIYGIIRRICDTGYFKSDVFNVCASGMSTSREVVEMIKMRLSSDSVVDVNAHQGGVTYVLSNKKLSLLYKPMDVKETIELYIKEMLAEEGENEKNT